MTKQGLFTGLMWGIRQVIRSHPFLYVNFKGQGLGSSKREGWRHGSVNKSDDRVSERTWIWSSGLRQKLTAMPDACRRRIDHRGSVARQPNLLCELHNSGLAREPVSKPTKQKEWTAPEKQHLKFFSVLHTMPIYVPLPHMHSQTQIGMYMPEHAHMHTHKVSKGWEHCWWRYVGNNICKESKHEAWWPAGMSWDGERKCAKVLARLGHKPWKGSRE